MVVGHGGGWGRRTAEASPWGRTEAGTGRSRVQILPPNAMQWVSSVAV